MLQGGKHLPMDLCRLNMLGNSLGRNEKCKEKKKHLGKSSIKPYFKYKINSVEVVFFADVAINIIALDTTLCLCISRILVKKNLHI